MFGWGYRLGKYGLSPVQFLILMALKRRPMYGYEIIKELREMFGDIWEPKTGTVYPALRRLEMKGLVKTELRDDKEFYSLTERGEDVLKYAVDLMETELDFMGRYHMFLPPPMRRMFMKRFFGEGFRRWRGGHYPLFIPPLHLEFLDREERLRLLKTFRFFLKERLEHVEELIRELEYGEE